MFLELYDRVLMSTNINAVPYVAWSGIDTNYYCSLTVSCESLDVVLLRMVASRNI